MSALIRSSAFKKYFLPGFVFQSVVIAGGYGTGRELVEFFLSNGPLGGLLGMILVSMVIWSVVAATTFEFSRIFMAYDYRAFFKRLLGRGWVLYEILYIIFLLIVLAVVAAAAGAILQELFGLPYLVGVIGIMLAIGLVVFGGTEVIENVMSVWSLVLYAVYIVLVVWAFSRYGGVITSALGSAEVQAGWIIDGVRYAAYNLAIIPAILFVAHHIETRREAVTAGLLAGPIAMIPAILLYLALVGIHSEVMDLPVPVNYLLADLGSRSFQLVFQFVLFGTLIETGAGFIHAVNERIAGVYNEKGRSMPRALRPAIGLFLLIFGAVLAQVGLIDLIAQGYGTLTWGFLLIYVVPVLTVGVFKIRAAKRERPENDPRATATT